jgi:hypothetical protein
MSTRLALCLLLTCASFAAGARDVRQAGANGDGGTCPEALSAAALEEAPTRAGDKRDPAATARSTRARGGGGGGDNPGVRAPRWHSFLPGMFR